MAASGRWQDEQVQGKCSLCRYSGRFLWRRCSTLLRASWNAIWKWRRYLLGADGRAYELWPGKYPWKPCKPYHFHEQQVLWRRCRKQGRCRSCWRRLKGCCIRGSKEGRRKDGPAACSRCHYRDLRYLQKMQQVHWWDNSMDSCKGRG